MILSDGVLNFGLEKCCGSGVATSSALLELDLCSGLSGMEEGFCKAKFSRYLSAVKNRGKRLSINLLLFWEEEWTGESK